MFKTSCIHIDTRHSFLTQTPAEILSIYSRSVAAILGQITDALIWSVRVCLGHPVFSLLSWLLRHGSHISGCGGFSTETQKGLPLMKCQALSVIAQYRPLRNASNFSMPCTGFDNKLNSFWYCDLCSNSYFSFHFLLRK